MTVEKGSSQRIQAGTHVKFSLKWSRIPHFENRLRHNFHMLFYPKSIIHMLTSKYHITYLKFWRIIIVSPVYYIKGQFMPFCFF